MNVAYLGEYIEKYIKAEYTLDDSKLGFDGRLNKLEVEIKACNKLEVEIKACIPIHKNGSTNKGKERTTKGRFWIDNHAHKLLLEERGLYIFVLYIRTGDTVIIKSVINKFAFEINHMINTGDNTKIRYDLLFPSYTPVGV